MELPYERGAYFEENSLPNVRGKVVIDTTENLHGEPAYRFAEKDTDEGKWYAYWQPTRHLDDEVGVGASEHVGNLNEEKLQSVEGLLPSTDASAPKAPKGVTRLKDVMRPAEVEALTGSRP